MSSSTSRERDQGTVTSRNVDSRLGWKPRRVPELPAVLAAYRELEAAGTVTAAVHTVIKGFCVEWRNNPAERAWMVDTGPDVAAGDPYDVATVAAVVRGLCERWGHPTPGWVEGIKAPTEISYMGRRLSNTPLDRILKARAAPACHIHGVYYEADLLEHKQDVLARVGAELAAARELYNRRGDNTGQEPAEGAGD